MRLKEDIPKNYDGITDITCNGPGHTGTAGIRHVWYHSESQLLF